MHVDLSACAFIFIYSFLLPFILSGYCFSNYVKFSWQLIFELTRILAFSLSYSRHGGHPAAPGLACWLQSEHSRSARAGGQLPLARNETFVHVWLRLHFLLLHPFLPVSPACILHPFRWRGLWPKSTAEWRTPDQHGLHKHAQLQDTTRHVQ